MLRLLPLLALALALALLASCTDPPAPPPPTTMATPPTTPPTTAPTPTATPAAPATTTPATTTASTGPSLAQLVIDDRKVAAFLHLENAANVPLTVWAGPSLEAAAPLLKAGGTAVSVVRDEKQARLVLDEQHPLANADHVRVRFRIPPEGVRGSVDLERKNGSWAVVDEDIAEK